VGSIHNELRRGGLSQALRNALQVTDAESGLERFSETLSPSIDLWSRPEWRLLRGERSYSGGVHVNANGGNLARVALYNPADSAVLVLIDEIQVWSTNTSDFYVYVMGAGSAPTGTTIQNVSVPRDSRERLTGSQTSIASLYAGNTNALTDGLASTWNLYTGGPAQPWRPGIVLRPDSWVEFRNNAVGQNIGARFDWTERAVLLGEING